MVTRNGKSYITTVYVNPNQADKAQTTNVTIPDWHFKTADEFEVESKRIAKIKDETEKRVLRVHLMEDLKKNGITWKEDTGPKAYAVNWMRAAMAAKKHLKAGNELNLTKKSEVSQANPHDRSTGDKKDNKQQSPAKVLLGTGQPMAEEDAKKAISDLRKELGTDKMIELAKANGITWKENPNHKANNYMRCAMAMRAHLENGGTITEGGANDGQQQPAQPAEPKPKKDPKEPPKDTVEYDYYHASPRGKIIAQLIGIVPADKEAEEYLYKRIVEGDFDVDRPMVNIPKAVGESVAYFARRLKTEGFAKLQRHVYFHPDVDHMFQNHPREQDFKDYKTLREKFNNKYSSRLYEEGVDELRKGEQIISILQHIEKKTKKDINKFSNGDTLLNIGEYIKSNDPEEIWKQLEFDKMERDVWYISSREPLYAQLLNSTGGVFPTVRSDVLQNTTKELRQKYPELKNLSDRDMLDGGKLFTEGITINGKTTKVPKEEFLRIFGNQCVKIAKDTTTYSSMSESLVDNFKKSPNQFLRVYYRNKLRNSDGSTKTANLDDAVKLYKEVSRDFLELMDPRFDWVEKNLVIHNLVKIGTDRRGSNIKPFQDWKPLDEYKLLGSAYDIKRQVEVHAWLMRKNTDQREKAEKKVQDNPYDILLSGDENVMKEKALDVKKIKGKVKASLETVGQTERQKIEGHIQRTHDKVNHRFKTIVHNVFHIKNLPIEKEFQQIDKERNNTDFYYHGTAYKKSQLIIGKSGQFKVPKEINAGRMLGDGVYLASDSSKSVQYASKSYGRSDARGVLFLCKASLGKVKESTVQSSTTNRRLLNQDDNVDTLYMGRPHVLNPEWAVKKPEAVIPRLWIDVERKNN